MRASDQDPASPTHDDLIKIEGREEGRVEGEVALALRQLNRKFPRIARKSATLVKAVDEPRLLAFGEALLFFETEAECQEWLKRG